MQIYSLIYYRGLGMDSVSQQATDEAAESNSPTSMGNRNPKNASLQASASPSNRGQNALF